MKIAWIEIWSGLSGDMLLGALLDAGWSEDRLRVAVESLNLGPFRLEVERRQHRGMTGIGLRVEVPADPPHRRYDDVVRILEAATLPADARRHALEAFRLLAEAEARVHGVSVGQVHFHEVGAFDSIVDIVGCAVAVHELGLERIWASPVPISHGEVRIAHGVTPVPAPATALLLEGWPVRADDASGEFVTPTAAALLRALAEPDARIPEMRVARVGYGAGTREHPRLPNLVRVWIGEASPEDRPAREDLVYGQVSVIEAQMDDIDPRFLSTVADQLLDAGALDVYRTPVLMKKGRLGTLVTIVARPDAADRLAGRLLDSTSTLGVRVRSEGRWEAPRRLEEVQTSLGPVRVKWVGVEGRRIPSVEHDDIVRISRESGLPLEEIRFRVLRETLPPG